MTEASLIKLAGGDVSALKGAVDALSGARGEVLLARSSAVLVSDQEPHHTRQQASSQSLAASWLGAN